MRLPLKSHLLSGNSISGCKGTHFFCNNQIFSAFFQEEPIETAPQTPRDGTSRPSRRHLVPFEVPPRRKII